MPKLAKPTRKNKHLYRLILLVAAILVAVAVVIFLILSRHIKQTQTPKSAASVQQKPSSSNKTITTPTPIVQSPETSLNTQQPQTPTPTPTPVVNINHPTLDYCQQFDNTFTVYASVGSGTPVYNRENPSEVLYTVPYGDAITRVYCNSDGTALTRYEGTEVFSIINFQDVSTTQP